VVSRSVIRDLYSGRQMARVMSLTFIIFIMVPVMAPTLGQVILQFWPWRSLFILFSVYGAIVVTWVALRLPETLHPEYRLSLTVSHVMQSAQRVITNRASVFYTLAVSVIFGSMIGYIGMVQQIFSDVFHRPELMPAIFAICAGSMGITSFINSRIVERIGMRRVSHTGLLLFIVLSGTHAIVATLGSETMMSFVVLQAATMSCMGLMVSNFGTMAMESMASVAGIAASFQGFVSTAGGALVGALIGRQFNGSTVPLAMGAALCGCIALSCVVIAERGRLLRPHYNAS
jgi:DHA1 family bicyclomycin/chloramphenicol resistance-like MFS transporter